jgi:Bacterial protein of unknown function (DUF899)
MTEHKVGTREEWLAARKELLDRERELDRLSDELTTQRRGHLGARREGVHVPDRGWAEDARRALRRPLGADDLSNFMLFSSQILERAPKGGDDTVPALRRDEYEQGSAARGTAARSWTPLPAP